MGSAGEPKRFRLISATEANGRSVAAYVFLPEHPDTESCVAETINAGHNVLLDLGHDGKLIGVEILLPLELEVVGGG